MTHCEWRYVPCFPLNLISTLIHPLEVDHRSVASKRKKSNCFPGGNRDNNKTTIDIHTLHDMHGWDILSLHFGWDTIGLNLCFWSDYRREGMSVSKPWTSELENRYWLQPNSNFNVLTFRWGWVFGKSVCMCVWVCVYTSIHDPISAYYTPHEYASRGEMNDWKSVNEITPYSHSC